MFVPKPANLAKNHRPTDLVSHFGVLCQESQKVYHRDLSSLRYDFKRLGHVKKKELFKNLNLERYSFWPVPTLSL